MISRFFKSQDYGIPTYQFVGLPIYQTKEFDFYRCVEFDEAFYGKTAYELHMGNLRSSKGRYSKLFPGQKISYWAGHPRTARKEMRAHNEGKSYLMFWAYDDGSSTFPLCGEHHDLVIWDARGKGMAELINKADQGKELTDKEKDFVGKIMELKPDCLAYESHADPDGENFIFFEQGFKNLAIREINLTIKDGRKRNRNCICCATSCDYLPYPESYGDTFEPTAKREHNNDFNKSSAYWKMQKGLEQAHKMWRQL